jgi:hypothetical protein
MQTAITMHHLFDHADPARLAKLGVKVPDDWFCDDCMEGRKPRNAKSKHVRIKAKHRGERMYMDILVSHTEAKFHKWKYVLVIVDECTNKLHAYPMKAKTEVPHQLSVFLADMRSQNVSVKTIICDSDPNFKDNRVRGLLADGDIRVRGLLAGQRLPIHLQFSSPSNQYQNGPAESAIRTIKRRGAAILVASKLPTPPEFFLYAVLHAAYHSNYTPCNANPEWATPNALWFDDKDISTDHLRVFGFSNLLPFVGLGGGL